MNASAPLGRTLITALSARFGAANQGSRRWWYGTVTGEGWTLLVGVFREAGCLGLVWYGCFDDGFAQVLITFTRSRSAMAVRKLSQLAPAHGGRLPA